MNKLTPEHLSRDAYVYVRQSTPNQLLNNPESRRRQYALETRARSLGWENVIVIDDDLGRSGGGAARPGFERLLAAICAGTAGAVFAIEASRLARNGRDWHTLLEFCVVVNSLIIDEDGIYDPRSVNDRLLLGLKGTFSELELSLFRQRSHEALRLKAARGELNTTVAIGYRRGADDRLEQDPDKRIREALSLVFRKFAEIGSVRQLALWLRQERIELPIAVRGAQGRSVQWRLPRYNTVHRLLTNPVYAGAYVYGRTFTRVRFEGGRKVATHGIARRPEEWDVVIRNHHDGYITWEEYDRNQKVIAGNANMKGAMVRGSVRNGSGLLVGLLRCGHCGRKLKVHHNERNGARYVCTTDIANLSNKNCIAFSNMRIDAAMSAEVLRAVSPLAMEAALQLIADHEHAGVERLRQCELALEQAGYEAMHARRQYDAVDPDNRLVAGELERRWNECLAAQRDSRRRWRTCATNSRGCLVKMVARCCWHSLMTCHEFGTIPMLLSKSASGSCGRFSWRSLSRSRAIDCAWSCIGKAEITPDLKSSRTALAKIASRPTRRPCSSFASSLACYPTIASPLSSIDSEYVRPEATAGTSCASATFAARTRSQSIARANGRSDVS